MDIHEVGSKVLAVIAGIGFLIFLASLWHVTNDEYKRVDKLKTYLNQNPTVYLNGEVVDPNSIPVHTYNYVYDAENNTLTLGR